VVSTARLSDDGFLGDREVLRTRTVKEVIHELGHTFGLIHCPRPECVMSRSVNLVQVDAKNGGLCRDCHIRYGELREQGHQHHE
jgi:archaemetzincin